MTPLTSMKGRHKAGQLQSSEGLRIPNLAQICQRQHPGKQLRAFGQCLNSIGSVWQRHTPDPVFQFSDPCSSPRLRASAVSFCFSDHARDHGDVGDLLRSSQALLPVFDPCCSPRLRASAVSFCFSDHGDYGDHLAIPYHPRPYPLCSPNFTQGHPSTQASAEGHNPISRSRAITRSPDLFHPHPSFSPSIANKWLTRIDALGLPCVTLGWPLGGPCVALGPINPKPNPRLRDIGRGSQPIKHKTQRNHCRCAKDKSTLWTTGALACDDIGSAIIVSSFALLS